MGETNKKYQLMIEPTPGGWAFGFPKALPESAVLSGRKAYDLLVHPDFNLRKWIVEEGYPEKSLGYWKSWAQEVKDKAYVYPGSDPQE